MEIPNLNQFFNPILTNPYIKSVLKYSPVWTPAEILQAIVAFTWAVYLWETYLGYRQFKILSKNASAPPELVGVIDQTTYAKSRLYNMEKSKFSFIGSLWEQLFQTGVLLFGGIPFLWLASERIIGHFGYSRSHEITHSIVFALLATIISTIIDLPWSLYSTFVIEERHGFNKETLGFYFKDRLKKLLVTQAITLPILACIIHIVKIGGDYFFVVLWIFCVFLTLVLMTVYPDFIAPLFDKFSSLPEGELRTKIESLAQSIDFPLTKLYVVEGSKRSAHSNAYLYGFFKNKRIVLFDTLLADYNPLTEEKKVAEDETDEKPEKKEEKKTQGCTNDEVVAVLAHELGHWKLNHVLKNLIIVQVNMFLCFAVFALLHKNHSLFAAFGFTSQRPVIISFMIIFQFVFQPYNEVMSFLMNVLSRRFEFQADAFAKFLNKAADLRSSLIKLHHDNLGFPVYDWLYSAYHHSHPPLLQRIRALGKLD